MPPNDSRIAGMVARWAKVRHSSISRADSRILSWLWAGSGADCGAGYEAGCNGGGPMDCP